MRAFSKGIVRSVRGSLGRFLAIAGIVALGCGFFAGLQMCGPDMRAAADAYYDRTALWDLRVVCTQGLGDKDLERLSEVPGVAAVSGVTSVDAMASVGSEKVAVRVSTLPEAYERGAGEPEMDRLVLRDGRWPEAAGECVASADSPGLVVSVGDTIEVLREAGEGADAGEGTSGVLEASELTVVGTVSSSAYPYTVSFGSTTLGSGTIDQYLFVTADSLSDDAPLTEAHLLVEGAAEAESGSAAYEGVVGEVSSGLEGRAGELAAARLEDVRDEARSRVGEAAAELEDERAAAESQLGQSRDELDAASEQLEEGEAELADGEARLESARSELAARRSDAQARLAEAQGQIDASQASLDEQAASLDARAEEVEEARAALSSDTPALLASLAEQGIEAADLDGAVSAIDAAAADAAASRTELEALVAQLEGLEASGAATEEQLASLAAARERLGQLAEAQSAPAAAGERAAALVASRDGVAAYDDGVAQVEAARAELEAARAQLASQRAAGQEELSAAQGELDAAEARLATSRAEVEDARSSLEEGERAWEQARVEADERLAEAQAELDDARAEVADLEPGEIYVLDRTQAEGPATYQADSERMDTIATIFPFMFFLVAALVALTTMTRMVEDERPQIGTYKALGYGTARIAGRYLAYAGAAATGGAVLGIALLTQVLPLTIMSAYAIIYAVPTPSLPLPVDPAAALVSGGMGVGCTLLATWAAVAVSVRESPAALMQPRAPRAGRRILLERVRPLWARLSFLRKVTARNLFRYKKRLLMTIVGISGCTALLLVGLGLHDAIWDIIDNEFGPILHYNAVVTLDDGAGAGEVEEVSAELADAGATDLAHVRTLNLQAAAEGEGSGSGVPDTLGVQVVLAEDADELSRAVSLRDRTSGRAQELSGDGVLLAEKTASKLGVSAGDTVRLYAQDAVGTPTGAGCALTVAGVVENYVGDVAYLGPDAWEALDAAGAGLGERRAFTTLYAHVGAGEQDRAALSERLEDTGLVSTVSFTDETVAMYEDMLSAVDLVVVVLIVSAAALAFIVLYNLTNINIAERVREIATLKVLGFFRGEVYAYVFREVLVLTLLGDVLGLVLGTWLEGVVIVTAEVDVVMFGRVIHPASYLAAFALTLAFAGLVMLAMRRKLDRVSMVESLKSVE